jgi:hypothetical protein
MLPLDFQSYAKKRYETIAAAAGAAAGAVGLSQEAIQMAQSILKAALLCGQTTARVQTLRLALNHYSFVTTRGDGGDESTLVYPLYDARTLALIHPKRCVYLSARGQDLVQWLQEHQQLGVMCTAVSGGGQPTMSPFVYIVAVLVPPPMEPTLVGSTGGGGGYALWNSVFQKNPTTVTAADIDQWNTRCVTAMRAGASHFTLATLYKGRDYRPAPTTGLLAGPLLCAMSLEHPTMAPLAQPAQPAQPALAGGAPNKAIAWTLSDTPFCRALSQWCSQAGYRWALAMKHLGPDRFSHWAYFVVLLDPLDQGQGF